VTIVVPSIGRSPLLSACLEALRSQAGPSLEVILVAQGWDPGAAARLADRTLRLEQPVGFARAANTGAASGRGELLGFVNDDAIVGRDWLRRLVEALDSAPRAGAAQGGNLRLGGPENALDGCGLAWNRHWQAVQLGHGQAPVALPAGQEVFGVSATAAVYRRRALDASAHGRPSRGVFDERLFAYYEDVELACRLRSRGWGALSVTEATAEHAGGASEGGLGRHPAALVHGNRILVLAGLLGRALLPRLPLILARDALDLAHALRDRDAGACRGVLAGWRRAAGSIRAFLHVGPPRVRLAELRRLSAESWRVAPPADGLPRDRHLPSARVR
jgi:GT2 family glycosyltransferase